MTKQKKTKPKGKIPTAKLPDRQNFQPEGRAVFPDEPPESTFDPNFPGRKAPFEQWMIDREFIWKIKDLPTFLKELKVVIKYWTFYDNPKLFGGFAIRITWEIFQKGERLRQDYLKQHPETNIRPLTNDLYEMESWRFDAERVILNPKDIPKRPQIDEEPIEIQFKFSKGPSKQLLQDLASCPSGVNYNPKLHGKKQPELLKGSLNRAGYKHYCKFFHKEADRIFCDKKIRLI